MHLFTFVQALRTYVMEAERQEGISSTPNCTLASLDNQIESLFPPDSPQGEISTKSTCELECLLPWTKEYTVAESKKPEKPLSRISLEKAMLLGETEADRRFKEGMETNFAMEGISFVLEIWLYLANHTSRSRLIGWKASQKAQTLNDRVWLDYSWYHHGRRLKLHVK